MGDSPHLPLDGRDNIGMGVAEHCAHLPRGEIEDGPPVGIVDEAALGALDDDRLEARP